MKRLHCLSSCLSIWLCVYLFVYRADWLARRPTDMQVRGCCFVGWCPRCGKMYDTFAGGGGTCLWRL